VTAVESTVVGQVVGRRAVRSGAGWGVIFGIYVTASVSGYAASFPTVASRARLAQSLGNNAGVRALIGPARRIDTVAGFASWRALGVLALMGAIWALLAGTRLLRGEEDAGRWELLLTTATTRRGAAVQGIGGLAVGWASLWIVTASFTVAEGFVAKPSFSVTASLFFSLALCSSAAVFLMVGALASQLAATRRQGATLAGALFGAAYLVRMVADSASGLRWLLWASPLGWAENMRPLTGSRPVMLVPTLASVVVIGALAIHLAGIRDVGSSIVADRDAGPSHTRLLSAPAGLAVRIARPVAIGWISGLALLGLVFGLVAQSAADAVSGNATVERALARLGGRHGGADAYLGLCFLFAAALLGVVAAGQIAANREEEALGRLDNLLVRPVRRSSWLAGRLLVATAILAACGVAAGIAAWGGAASQHAGTGFWRLVEAGLNMVPPALFVLGVGTLVHAAAPRLVSITTYGIVGWAFMVELLGSIVKMPQWMLDSSVLYHVAPAPATDPHWVSAAALTAIGIAAAVVGAAIFAKRDLIAA
jgi:ABC-2 type transport system permease protein